MGFGQARRHQTSARVDDAGVRSGQRADLLVAADREDATILDRDGLCIRQRRIGGEDLGIDQDQLRGGESGRADKKYRCNLDTCREAADRPLTDAILMTCSPWPGSGQARPALRLSDVRGCKVGLCGSCAS